MRPITAAEISNTTGIKVATCRTCLSRLARKGFIKKYCYGYYIPLSYDVTLGSSMVQLASHKSLLRKPEPRLHCLHLRIADCVGITKKFDYDLVKISFKKHANGNVQVFVDCVKGYSFDYVAFRLLLEFILQKVRQTDWKKMLVTSYEFNHDYEGIRLDGAKAITLTAFDGSFRRLYNKRFGLRDEVRAVGSVQVDQVLTLLKGSHVYNESQVLSNAIAELRKTNNIVAEAAHSMHRLAEAVLERKGRGQSNEC